MVLTVENDGVAAGGAADGAAAAPGRGNRARRAGAGVRARRAAGAAVRLTAAERGGRGARVTDRFRLVAEVPLPAGSGAGPDRVGEWV